MIERQVTQSLSFFALSLMLLPLGYCPYPIPWVSCLICPNSWCPSKRISPALASLILLQGVSFGRLFCGWLCPYGALQEMFGKLPLAKRLRNLRWPKLEPLKFAAFAISLILVIQILYFFPQPQLPTNRIDLLLISQLLYPRWIPAFLNSPLSTLLDFIASYRLILFFLFIAAAFLITRFWCHYLCPIGASLSPFNRIGIFRLKLKEKKCTKCGVCDKVCFLGEKHSDKDGRAPINSVDCTRCLECLRACPLKAIEIKPLFTKA